MEERPVLLGQLTRVLAATAPRSPLPLRLCIAFTEMVAAQGAAITIGFNAPDRATLCATDTLADRAEDSQDVLREGPSLDAFRTRTPVCGLSHTEQVSRWPMLSEVLDREDRPMLLHAFPMRPDSEVLGVLSAYQTHERGLARSCEDAQFLADAIGVAVLGGIDSGEDSDLLWGARDQVSQATGMVVAQLKIAPPDALALLRAHAFAHGTTVAEVGRAILVRDLDFGTDRQGDDP
ncbi:MAG: ANTAR domain-containing protein [Marmoricola sp.]